MEKFFFFDINSHSASTVHIINSFEFYFFKMSVKSYFNAVVQLQWNATDTKHNRLTGGEMVGLPHTK